MAQTTQTVDLKLKNGETASEYFDEMDEDMREEFKDDAPVSEVIIGKGNK